jgi:EAL domain-containing protein (putative c-di-GMP-specific phosphodiesterase class I)
MHLQVQVRLSDLAVVGDEALARWRLADGSMAMPNNFVPLLEHTGAVVALGQRMIELAVQQLLARPGSERRISVNLSVRQLEEPDFPDWLIAHCEQAGLARHLLRLEITESAFALDGDQVGAALARLTQAGFELSIDDFGTGQSSLGRLAEIQVRELKLDRSLVHGIEHDKRARRVAGLIVELGRDLGVDVLAEGIETEGQLAVLRELGCALGQGWLFGRPVPPAFAAPSSLA